MRKFAFSMILILLLTACGAGSAGNAPAPTATSAQDALPRLFTFYGDDPSQPIIANGEPDHWTGKFMNPGGVVYHDGLFHMFLNAFHNWPGEVSIGHYTSPDGFTWTPAQEDPLFTSNDIPLVSKGQGADVSSALVLQDGTWVLYFHVVGSNPAGIGRATAPAPEGPWSFDEAPVLVPGSSGEWDDRSVSWPNVVATDDGYVMYYSGASLSGTQAIGRATSPDGITWTKYDDPATSDAPYAESDPVLEGSGGRWDFSKSDRPRAVLSPDGWVMFYTGSILFNRGLAFSADGIHWEGYAGNPAITRDDFPIAGGNTWDTDLYYHDGTYYYFMEIGTGNRTAIYLATHEGSLSP